MHTDQLIIMNENIIKLFIPITIHFNYHLIYLLIINIVFTIISYY